MPKVRILVDIDDEFSEYVIAHCQRERDNGNKGISRKSLAEDAIDEKFGSMFYEAQLNERNEKRDLESGKKS